MKNTLFDFFEKRDMNACFFTGEAVGENDRISVFPKWVLQRYDLADKYLGMLGLNRAKYGEITVPCSASSREKLLELEDEIKTAFLKGYPAVAALPQKKIFQWMAKLVLTILYHEFIFGIKQKKAKGQLFHLSPLLTRRFRDLHYMLQSLWIPMEWPQTPWSMQVVPVSYTKDGFNYRDETRFQNFSLGMNGFGIVCCLQDNGENMEYHQYLLDKIEGLTLHPIQFEELCARFIYSNYQRRDHPGYEITEEQGHLVMTPIPRKADVEAFKPWDDKVYGTVLAEYWKPWGISGKDIGVFPDTPLSFLINEMTNELILPEKIDLPA